ncbi:MAG: DUF6916 family protein [Gaiellaceae bacterium]
MLESLTIDDFSGRLGERFVLELGEGSEVETQLIEAKPLEAGPESDARTPFSIVFLGPHEPLLAQRIYPLRHDQLGTFGIFIVPIGRDADGVRYEAIFT